MCVSKQTSSEILAVYGSKIYKAYIELMHLLNLAFPSMERNFPESVFAACTFNFGPQTATYLHRDSGNRAVGFCSIFAAGSFNYKRGGHLILEEYGIVLEFPPRCTVFIPSATCTHGNVRIGRNETRYGFTQFTAGGLFRYVDYGFQTWKQYTEDKDNEWMKAERKRRQHRWKEEIKLFSKYDELEQDQFDAFVVRR